MEFVNTEKDERVRLDDESEKTGFRWITLKKGGTVNLPETVGLAYGFVPAGTATVEKAEVNLKKLNRGALNAHASTLGVDSPEDLENKNAVIAAIEAKNAEETSKDDTDAEGAAEEGNEEKKDE